MLTKRSFESAASLQLAIRQRTDQFVCALTAAATIRLYPPVSRGANNKLTSFRAPPDFVGVLAHELVHVNQNRTIPNYVEYLKREQERFPYGMGPSEFRAYGVHQDVIKSYFPNAIVPRTAQ